MQIRELAFVRRRNVRRLRTQGVLHAALGIIDPLLELGRPQIVRTVDLRYGRLALDDVEHQLDLALGGPSFISSSIFILIVLTSSIMT